MTQHSSPESADLLLKAQAFVDRKYVARADARQKDMGLAYIEAERQDLAREIVRFVESLGVNAQRQQEPTADQSWQYARQIVCEEWQRAVKEHGLRPGSVTEKVVALIINRLDGVSVTSTMSNAT